MLYAGTLILDVASDRAATAVSPCRWSVSFQLMTCTR